MVDLTGVYEQMSRRRLLKLAAGLTAGTVSLSWLIESVEGAEPEGKPLVQTVGRNNQPAQVKIVSNRRHSILKRYETLNLDKLAERYSSLSAVGLTNRSDDEDDLAFEFVFDGDEVGADEAAEIAPQKHRGVPVVFGVETVERTPEHLRGGSDISVGFSGGTATGVFSNSNSEEVVLTNEHVGNGGSTISYNGTVVGNLDKIDDDTDTSSYVLRDNVDADARRMMDPLDDVATSWTYAGLSDHVSSEGSLEVELYGRTSGHVEDKVVDTRRSRWWNSINWDYEIHMDTHSTAAGDSGAPWVAGNQLVAQHVGMYEESRLFRSDKKYSVGTAAMESVRAVDATLW